MFKRIFIVSFILSLITVSSFSQLKERDNLLGPSLGFWTSPNAPTFGLNYEAQIAQLGDVSSLGLGGVFRYTTFRDNYPSTDYYSYNYLTFGLQTNFNFNEIGDGRFVPFVGLVLGYNSVSSSYVNNSGRVYSASYGSGMWLWGQFGMRYFFSPRVAGSLRFGAGNFNFDVIELGIDFKL
jgi:hypothetical protein